MPGKLIQNFTKVGVKTHCSCSMRRRKMSSDMRGDPASALLEVLDPSRTWRSAIITGSDYDPAGVCRRHFQLHEHSAPLLIVCESDPSVRLASKTRS
ncbi:hypothetical protein KCP76_16045 [Salmonella enterica subsp. enterica serovar Weltevreden]|nr:hypothetical protein KCP76_16045 [Salmonella enterica subsp. enterica serovar Weltevreden]